MPQLPIPTFDGNCSLKHFISWVADVNIFCYYNNIAEEKEARIISGNICGFAKQYWNEVQFSRVQRGKLPYRTWPSLKKCLMKTFFPENIEEILECLDKKFRLMMKQYQLEVARHSSMEINNNNMIQESKEDLPTVLANDEEELVEDAREFMVHLKPVEESTNQIIQEEVFTRPHTKKTDFVGSLIEEEDQVCCTKRARKIEQGLRTTQGGFTLVMKDDSTSQNHESECIYQESASIQGSFSNCVGKGDNLKVCIAKENSPPEHIAILQEKGIHHKSFRDTSQDKGHEQVANEQLVIALKQGEHEEASCNENLQDNSFNFVTNLEECKKEPSVEGLSTKETNHSQASRKEGSEFFNNVASTEASELRDTMQQQVEQEIKKDTTANLIDNGKSEAMCNKCSNTTTWGGKDTQNEVPRVLILQKQKVNSAHKHEYEDFLGVESLLNAAASNMHDLIKLLNVKELIHVTWKRLNKERFKTSRYSKYLFLWRGRYQHSNMAKSEKMTGGSGHTKLKDFGMQRRLSKFEDEFLEGKVEPDTGQN